MKNNIIGYIKYIDSKEIINYADKEKYIKDFKETLDCYGIMGFEFKTYDKELTQEIRKILIDEFGGE